MNSTGKIALVAPPSRAGTATSGPKIVIRVGYVKVTGIGTTDYRGGARSSVVEEALRRRAVRNHLVSMLDEEAPG